MCFGGKNFVVRIGGFVGMCIAPNCPNFMSDGCVQKSPGEKQQATIAPVTVL